MKTLRQIIKENLLLEKRIGQIVTSITVNYAFEIDRSQHAYIRRIRTDISDYNDREISNGEIKFVIDSCRKDIAEKIATGDIKEGEDFVVKSNRYELAIAITPIHQGGSSWKLLIRTVFRESLHNPFRVGENQLVIWV